jgi:inhibitor of KinA sporulation pathway (predicted exonuclease)
MARLLDQIVVVDVEATCWEGAPPKGETSEIIEIGVCLLRVADGVRSSREGILVVPQRSRVSEFCTQLTTLTQEQVDGGCSFEEACRLLVSNYRTRERTWASYGDFDRRIFERQCRETGVTYPFGPTHLNVKNLFALTRALKREVGMAEALKHLHLPLEGTHHRAEDDAWNVAAVLAEIL